MNDLPQTFMEPILFKSGLFTRHAGAHEHGLHEPPAGCRRRDNDLPRPAVGRGFHRSVEVSSSAPMAATRWSLSMLGLPFDGKMGVGGSMNILFRADLSKYVAHRPSVLYWVMQPGADVGGIGMGLVRMVRPWNEWLIVWGYDINQPPPAGDGGTSPPKLRANWSAIRSSRSNCSVPIPGPSTTASPREMSEGSRILHGRCRPSASALQWTGLQHLDPGRVQSRLEACQGRQGAGRSHAAGQLSMPSVRRSPGRS